MSRSMIARCLAFLFLCAVFAVPTLLAQPIAVKEKLPDGVTIRLGGGGLRGHHAALSPDGKLIATSVTDGGGKFKFCLRNARDGKLIYASESKDFEDMFGCVFSHDSKLLAGTEVKDGVPQGTCLWDVAKQKSRVVLPLGVFGNPPVFSPDDKLIALWHPGRGIELFDVATGKLRKKLPYFSNPPNPSVAMAFLPDSKTLVVGEDGDILRFWDVERGVDIREIPLKGNIHPVNELAVSPDGKRLATNQVGRFKGLFRVVDLDSGKELYRMPIAACLGLAFSPDGKYLVRGVIGHDFPWNSRIEVIEAATGKEIRRAPAPGTGPKSIQFTSDGKTLMACGNDLYVRTWTFPDLKPRFERVGHTSRVESLIISPDGKMLCSRAELDRDKLIFWDVATGRPKHVWKYPHWWEQAHITPGGTHFVECKNFNGVIKVFEIATHKEVHKLKTTRGAVAMAPDGKTLAVGSLKDHEILLWDVVAAKEVRRWKGLKELMVAMAFSPDGRWLAAATEKTVSVWWTTTGELYRTFNFKQALEFRDVRVGHLVFSADGHWLHAEGDGGEVAWDLLTGNRVHIWPYYGQSGRLFLGNGPIHWMLPTHGGSPYLSDVFRYRGIAPVPTWARDPFPQLVLALSRDGTTFAASDKEGTILVGRTADCFEKPERVALRADGIAELWRNLGAKNEDGHKAYKAFKVLADADKDVVAFLAKRLSPVKGPDARQLAKWLADLDSKEAKVRTAAIKELQAWGTAVEMSLRNASVRMGKEGRAESKSLLDQIEKNLVEEESLRTLRAVAVLAAMGTPEAREVRTRLATGAPGSRITETARLVLPRMAK